MGINDLLGFDDEKYAQSLHSKYPTIAALQANEKKKSEQIAAATGGTAASVGLGFVIGPVAAVGAGLSGRSLSIAKQKRDLIRKELEQRYKVGKTRMSGKTFFKNAGLAVVVKAGTAGLGHGIEHFCVPPGIDAAPHGFDAAATALAHPGHCLEGAKEGVMSELHAIHTLATTGSPDAAAEQAAMQLAYGPTGDNAYLAGAVIGDHAAREVEKGVAKLAVKGASKLASHRLNNPTTPHSKPTTSKLTTKPIASKSATKPTTLKPATKPTTSKPATKPLTIKSAIKPADSKSTTKPTTSPTVPNAQEGRRERRKPRLHEKTQKAVTAAAITIPLKRRTRELKQQPQTSLGKRRNNSMANWVTAACIIIPAVAVAFYAPSLFGVWLNILFKILTDLLAFIGYALAKTTISVTVIISFVGHLLGIVAKFILTVVLPSVLSFVRYGLLGVAGALLGIFGFIGYLLNGVTGFVVTMGSN
jgi:hypothetical protein